MSKTMMIAGDRLLAWYHGELPEAEAETVAAALAGDPAAQALVDEWQAQDGALKALFAPVAEEPVPPRLAEVTRASVTPRWLQLAAMISMLAVGLAGGWFAAQLSGQSDPASSLAEAAIAAHETYVVEVLHPVEVTAEDAAHLTGWVSKRLGHEIAPPDFAAEGFRLMGGRVLPGATGAAAMFLYENEVGRRVSLYVAPTPDPGETAFQFAEAPGVQSFWWTDRDLSYAVVGDVPRDALRAIAIAAYDQLI